MCAEISLKQIRDYVGRKAVRMEFKLFRILGFGFFSDGFRLLESYMDCKKNGKKFYLKSADWLFGHTLGWNDYFTTLTDTTDEELPEINASLESNKEFTVAQFKEAIREVFVYQPYLLERADALIKELELVNFVSIFIRRGDKLLGESLFIPSQFYVQRALEKNPDGIFVQTDDYRAFLEVREITHSINPAIRVVTTCPPTKFGMFTDPLDMSKGRSMSYQGKDGKFFINSNNLNYLSTNVPQKPLAEYTKEEMRIHIEEMLVGIIVCQKANFLVIDHMSNCTRFAVFSHPRGKEAILGIEDLNIKINDEFFLIKRYDYDDNKNIKNPRFHSIYNEYI